MRDVYKFLGMDHIKTAPYRRQSNSCLERFHHTLLQMVRNSEADKKDWGVYLPYFLFSCGEAPSSVTGFSPFDLLLGKHVHGPLDIIREQWVPSSKTTKSAEEYLQELCEMLAAMRAVAAINQDKAKEYSKMKHDLKAKIRDFPIGTKVLVFASAITGTRAEKLSDCWQGPYEIPGTVTPVTYVVDMQERK